MSERIKFVFLYQCKCCGGRFWEQMTSCDKSTPFGAINSAKENECFILEHDCNQGGGVFGVAELIGVKKLGPNEEKPL